MRESCFIGPKQSVEDSVCWEVDLLASLDYVIAHKAEQWPDNVFTSVCNLESIHSFVSSVGEHRIQRAQRWHRAMCTPSPLDLAFKTRF